MKILIVEDHQRLGRFLKQSLTEYNYTVEWATTCEKAKDHLAEKNFDVIILDL
ncbi:MAG: response regulator, partial [Alphaproteobacteria bacterium]|nr:response regulator [Alphaproteobacteria bacterium]